MKLRLIKLRDPLADSFWFLPAVMAFLAGGFALGSVAFDQAIGTGGSKTSDGYGRAGRTEPAACSRPWRGP